MATVKDIQSALTAAGFDPGPEDGVLGALTRTAIRQFQQANGLEVDGIVGRNTLAKLLPGASPKAVDSKIPVGLPWLHEAHRHIGVREIKGIPNNATIMNWAGALKIGYSSDEVAWCGLFTGHCIGSQLPSEGLPQGLLGARNWLSFGRKCKAQFGSVLVFWRVSKADWRGHVGFYWGEDDTHFHVLGGNQNNSVSVKRIPRSRLLEARWPKTVAEANITRIASPEGALISTSEA